MRIFRKLQSKLNWSTGQYLGVALSIMVLGYLASATYQVYKPMPNGLNVAGPIRHAEVKFLADHSYVDAQGTKQQQQQIFDQVLSLIQEAQSTIVIDMFLFNQELGESTQSYRPLTKQLTEALIHQRQMNPKLEVKFITDPINSLYGGFMPEQYRQLRQAGIDVIETNLTPLRASNPAWSGFWYMCCQGVANNPERGWLPNPFGDNQITIRSYLHLLNFKANHRKTIVVDSVEGWKSLITSANPHDGSARHANVALLVNGHTALDILKTEQPVANMSDSDVPVVIVGAEKTEPAWPQVQVLTEAAIYDAVLRSIESAKAQDQIDLAMFYLSERKIIQQLIAAQKRGVQVRVLLDPNKDAFGRQKNGMPNRQVASELHAAGVNVRWCDTQGEQCHSKMLLKYNKQQAEIILGSANFTARNLKNYNLETDLRVFGAAQLPVFIDAQQFFNQSWSNLNAKRYSLDYTHYADESKLKYWGYRFLEWSGLSTF